MKTQSALCLTILMICTLKVNCALGDEIAPNRTPVAPSAPSDAVSSVATHWTDIEKLWPQQSDKYFIAINAAASTLSGLTNDPNARQWMRIAFTAMVAKPLVTNVEVSCVCLRRKCDAILQFLNSVELRNDKATWIAIAKYIGEIRTQVVPNYKRRGFANPPGAMASSLEKAQQAIQENERNKAMDRFQQELLFSDRTLTFFLLHNAGPVFSDAAERETYVQEIKSLGHLTEEERRQL